MSTILDALRRLEADKRRAIAAEGRVHDPVVGPEPEAARGRRRLLAWVAGGAVLLVAVVAGGLLAFALAPRIEGLREGETSALAAEAEAAPAAAAAPVPIASAPTAPAPTAGAPARAAGAPSTAARGDVPVARAARVEPAEAADRPLAPARAAPERASPPAPGRDVAPEAASASVASAVAGASGGAPAGVGAGPRATRGDDTARRAPAGARAVEEPTARPIAALPVADAVASTDAPGPSVARSAPHAASSGASAGAAPSAAQPAPTASDPRVVARAAEVAVVKTVWHPSADRRVAHVTVAGRDGSREVREGDLVEGLEVREIRLSGVVFERGGVEIERRVQGRR